ncbi:MAG: epsH 1 [Bacteroidetes bacterium]|nr:epsH 1 [Bacteroidota bacterium]
MNPFFSVIIPLYNKEKYIRETLNSVFFQHFSDYEVIVINDGSKDGGGNIVRELADPRIRYYETENRGVSSARNLGISLAKGKFIAFLDADDYWYPHFLEEIYTHICRFPEQKVFSTAIEFEYKGKVSKAEYSVERTSDHEIVDFFEASYHEAVLFTSASVFENTVFAHAGVFDPLIKSGQDTDLWIRIGLKYKILFIWRISVRYIYDSNSLSRNISNLREKADYSKYLEFESKNKALKKYIDYNRFSLAIKSKLHNDRSSFNYFLENIDLKSLPWKKRILLFLPARILQTLVRLKNKLMKMGLTHSVFVE